MVEGGRLLGAPVMLVFLRMFSTSPTASNTSCFTSSDRPLFHVTSRSDGVWQSTLPRYHSHDRGNDDIQSRRETATTHAKATTTSTGPGEGGHVGSKSLMNNDATHPQRTETVTTTETTRPASTTRCQHDTLTEAMLARCHSRKLAATSHDEQKQRAKR